MEATHTEGEQAIRPEFSASLRAGSHPDCELLIGRAEPGCEQLIGQAGEGGADMGFTM